MIKRHIEYLKSKPEHVREKYALLYATIFSLVVFGVWFSSLSFTLNNGERQLAKGQDVPGPLVTALSPIKDSLGEVKSGWASVIQSINIFKK